MKSYFAISLALCASILSAQEVEKTISSTEIQQVPTTQPVVPKQSDTAKPASKTVIVTPVVQKPATAVAETQTQVQTSTQASTKNPTNSTKIRLLPVTRTPESETATVLISLPEKASTVAANPVWLQVRVEGYPLGASSQFDREKEIAVSDLGQTVHVVVDNYPYFAINDPALDPFNEAGWYYETNYKFEIPENLGPGEHLVRVFLARSYGESLKGDQTFFATNFFVGKNGEREQSAFNLKKPFLTFNEPSNQLFLEADNPVLLDFLISNCELSNDGYKVRLTIDRKATRTLTEWRPYYIYGLSEGQHTVRLELLNPSGNLVPGPFNDVEQTITIHRAR